MKTDIATIEKNKIEELRVALKEYKGHDYVDVRTYVEPYADEGQGRAPTKKGVALALTKLPELIAALQQAESEARAAGLLPNWTEGMAILADEEARRKLERYLPAKRLAKPEEIAGIATYLASDAAVYLTGQVVWIEGGALSHV